MESAPTGLSKPIKRPSTEGSTTNSTKDNSINSENELDDDEEDEFRDPPVNYIRFRPSAFKAIPPTVFIEYPPELKIKRTDENVLELQKKKKLCYKSPFYDRICIKNAFRRAGFVKLADKDSADDKFWTALWSKHQSDNQMRDLNCLQKINHFPDSWCVGRKDRLNKTMHSMRRQHGKEFDYHPEGYILPNERDAFLRKVNATLSSSLSSQTDGSNLWIMKPRASSCGRGIKVITSQQAIQLDKAKSVIMQKYLHDPYLIDGRKFDLRIYVLVTGVDPLRVYVHKEGLTRISTGIYSLKNIKNRFAHLTNYSINKKSRHFKAAAFDAAGTFGDSSCAADASAIDGEREGFKWSLHAFKRWLAEQESPEVASETFEKIYDLCVKTCIAAESYITPKLHSIANYRSNCFELFGLDVILDTKLQPHLLEVNVSPSLNGSSPLDKKIKGTLIADILHTVGLYAFDKTLLAKYDSNNETPLHGLASTTASSQSNPFTFHSLSSMMESQDLWRKNQHPDNINLKTLDKNDSAWLLLLMCEDEMSRSRSTQFRLMHPTHDKCVHYNRLYKNQRFSDHLLSKWVLDGQSKGSSRRFIPSKFMKEPHPVMAVSRAVGRLKIDPIIQEAASAREQSATTCSSFGQPTSRPASARPASASAVMSSVSPAAAAGDTSLVGCDVERYNMMLLKELSSPTTKFSRYLYEKHSVASSLLVEAEPQRLACQRSLLPSAPYASNASRDRAVARQRLLPQISLPSSSARCSKKSEPLLLSSRSKM